MPTYGPVTDAGTRIGSCQTVKNSFYFKDDSNREGNINEPTRTFRDQAYSAGFRGAAQISSRTFVILEFSANHLDVLNAQTLVSGNVLPCSSSNVWAYNSQGGLFHALTERRTLARKTRQPTIKDSFEVGYTQGLAARTFVEVAAFQSNVSHSTRHFFVQPNVFQPRDPGEARCPGTEFGIRTSLTNALQIRANYAYLSRRNQTMPSIIMLDTQRNDVYSTAVYFLHCRLTAFADFPYVGGRWAANDAGRVLRTDSLGIAEFGGAATLYRGAELQPGIRNLVDVNYVYVADYPEAGRNWYVNLEYCL